MQVLRHQKPRSIRYRRRAQALKSKQAPAQAKLVSRILEHVQAKTTVGKLVLNDLDECELSPTLLVGDNGILAGW